MLNIVLNMNQLVFAPYESRYGRKPRLALDIVLGLVNTEVLNKDYCTYIEDLKSNLCKSYEVASAVSRRAKSHQKKYYDMKQRGSVVQVGDRVLVKIVHFEGKHKIGNRWEDEAYVILKQPNQDIPVYVVQRENGTGPKRTLHRNLLLPIGSLPFSSGGNAETKPKTLTKVSKSSGVEKNSITSSCSDSEMEEDMILVSNTNIQKSRNFRISDDDEHAQLEFIDGEQAQEPESVPQRELDAEVQPRRSQRIRRLPEKFRSGEYVMSQHIKEPEWLTKVNLLKTFTDDAAFSGMKDNLCQAMIDVVIGKHGT